MVVDNDFQTTLQPWKLPAEGNNRIIYDSAAQSPAMSSTDYYGYYDTETGEEEFLVATSTYMLGAGTDWVSINAATQAKANAILFDGGDGNDTIDGAAFALGGDGNDLLKASTALTQFNYGSPIASDRYVDPARQYKTFLAGGVGNDTLTGGALRDELVGGSGDDSISGGAGNDTLQGDSYESYITDNQYSFYHLSSVLWLYGAYSDTIDGGAGDDSIEGGGGNNRLTGGSGNDTITADSGGDTIDAGDGDDSVWGGDGSNSILGGCAVRPSGQDR